MAYQAGPGERPKVIRCTRVGACETHVMARCGPSELNLSRGLRAAPRPTPRVPKLRLRQQTAACVRSLHVLEHRTRHLLFPGMSSVWGAWDPWPPEEAWEAAECWVAARTSHRQYPSNHNYDPRAPCHHRVAQYPSARRLLARPYPSRMRTSQPESLLTSMELPRRQRRQARGWSAQYVMMRWCVK